MSVPENTPRRWNTSFLKRMHQSIKIAINAAPTPSMHADLTEGSIAKIPARIVCEITQE
jgi:hypothetical protein